MTGNLWTWDLLKCQIRCRETVRPVSVRWQGCTAKFRFVSLLRLSACEQKKKERERSYCHLSENPQAPDKLSHLKKTNKNHLTLRPFLRFVAPFGSSKFLQLSLRKPNFPTRILAVFCTFLTIAAFWHLQFFAVFWQLQFFAVFWPLQFLTIAIFCSLLQFFGNCSFLAIAVFCSFLAIAVFGYCSS